MPLHDLLFFIRKLNGTFAFVLAKVYLYKVKASCLFSENQRNGSFKYKNTFFRNLNRFLNSF